MKNPALALGAVLAIALPALGQSSSARAEDIYWYYDADTALRMAARTGRPIVLLKVRADIGPDVKT